MVVESKKSRDELTSVRLENQQLSSDMSQLERNPLFHLLEYEDLSHVQMLDIKEIVESENDRQTDGQTPGQGSSVVELRAVRRKLADKSEQLQLLQGNETDMILFFRCFFVDHVFFGYYIQFYRYRRRNFHVTKFIAH